MWPEYIDPCRASATLFQLEKGATPMLLDSVLGPESNPLRQGYFHSVVSRGQPASPLGILVESACLLMV